MANARLAVEHGPRESITTASAITNRTGAMSTSARN